MFLKPKIRLKFSKMRYPLAIPLELDQNVINEKTKMF